MTTPRNRLAKRLQWLAAALLTGAVLLPALAYVAAKQVVGPYEGKYGVADYVQSILVGASRGEAPALVLILSPGLFLLLWLAVRHLWRRAAPGGH
jgi:hypothetical protein